MPDNWQSSARGQASRVDYGAAILAINNGAADIDAEGLCLPDDWDDTNHCLRVKKADVASAAILVSTARAAVGNGAFLRVKGCGRIIEGVVDQTTPAAGEVYGMISGQCGFYLGVPGYTCLAKLADNRALLMAVGAVGLAVAQGDAADGVVSVKGAYLDSGTVTVTGDAFNVLAET